jgi:TetR/AcrR family transcriptional regulator, ethionamide resistance regulator
MPSVTKPNRRLRALRRAELSHKLRVAVERLLEGGETYMEMSVDRLVEEADVARSTFYVYFEDKGTLLIALTEDLIAEMIDAGNFLWHLRPRASRQELRDALNVVFDAYDRHRLLMGAVIETAAYDPDVRREYDAMFTIAQARFIELIRNGQEKEYVRRDIEPEATAFWLTWMWERGMHKMGQTIDQRDRLLDGLTAIFWDTLFKAAKRS